jgi:hypothetical protein
MDFTWFKSIWYLFCVWYLFCGYGDSLLDMAQERESPYPQNKYHTQLQQLQPHYSLKLAPYLARISPRISLRERPRPRDDHTPLFLLAAVVAVATAVFHKTCVLTGCTNELKCHLFILICPMTFLVGLT